MTTDTALPAAANWSEIELISENSGIYAWYLRLSISKADIDETIRRVKDAKDEAVARKVVEAALSRFLFEPLKETSYEISIRGALKPHYRGEVRHVPLASENLVKRLVISPERLHTIASMLKVVAPWFTAPLYIGMATNLRKRLLQHKQKIMELRDLYGPSRDDNSIEAGFASQVVARRLDPTDLFVHVAEMPVSSDERADIENLLNRINFPVFGRN